MERGRTIFHSLLDNYPKRIDLLVVFLDMEEKAQEWDAARRLYERAATLKLSSKKMKYFLRRWLAFEKVESSVESCLGDGCVLMLCEGTRHAPRRCSRHTSRRGLRGSACGAVNKHTLVAAAGCFASGKTVSLMLGHRQVRCDGDDLVVADGVCPARRLVVH